MTMKTMMMIMMNDDDYYDDLLCYFSKIRKSIIDLTIKIAKLDIYQLGSRTELNPHKSTTVQESSEPQSFVCELASLPYSQKAQHSVFTFPHQRHLTRVTCSFILSDSISCNKCNCLWGNGRLFVWAVFKKLEFSLHLFSNIVSLYFNNFLEILGQPLVRQTSLKTNTVINYHIQI